MKHHKCEYLESFDTGYVEYVVIYIKFKFVFISVQNICKSLILLFKKRLDYIA